MNKKLLLLLLTIASLSSVAEAQSTSVTLQVTDAGAQSWNNGTWTVVLKSQQGATNFGPPFNLVGGGSVPNQTQSGSLSASGGASITLTPNASVLPSQSGWQFSVCPAQGVPFQCFIQFVVISGASQTVTLTPPTISVNCGPGVNAYADAEVGCQVGGQYYNFTQGQRQCTASTGTVCSAWAAAGGGSALLSDNPVSSGLVAQYQINPTDTVASLKDYSGNGNNATGTVGTAPTMIANSGGLQCGGAGAVILPAALNSALTVQLFLGYQNTIGVSGLRDQSFLAGNGNGTNNNAIQFMLSSNGTAGSPGTQPAAARLVIKTNNSYGTAALNTFYGNDVVSWVLSNPDTLYQGQTLAIGSGSGSVFGNSAGGQTVGAYQLCGAAAGSGNSNISYFSGQVYYALFYNRALSSAEVAQNVAFMRNQMAARGVQTFESQNTLVNNLVILGDSISVTSGLSTSPYNLLTLYDTWNVTNQSVSGTTTCGMVPNAGQTIDPLYSTNATRNVVILATISNDISGTNPNFLGVLQCVRQFVGARKAVGWKVLLVTMIDRVNVSNNKNTWNTLLRQMWAQIGADGLIDYAANPNIGCDGCNSNATYFQDTIHPTTLAVNTIMAPMASFIVNRLFGNSYNSGAPVVAKNQAAGVFLQQFTISDATNLTSRTITLPNPVYPGSLLTYVTRVTPTSITDTNGDTWTQTAALGGGSIWNAVNVRGGEPNSITITRSSANIEQSTFTEHSGMAVSPLDVNAASSGTGTAMTGGGPTTTVANDLVLGAGFNVSGGTVTAGGAFTLRSPSPNIPFIEDEIFAGPGVVTATATDGTSGNWNMITAAYKTLANTTYPMGAQDIVLYCSPAGGSQTVNLPEAQYLAGGGTNFGGGTITVKNIQTAGANTCTVAGINAETIDGAASVTVANKATLIVKAVLVSPSAAGANWIQVQNN